MYEIVCVWFLVPLSHEAATELSDVKTTIAQLYSSLNVEEHQRLREKELLARLENVKVQLQPYEAVSIVYTLYFKNLAI